MDIRAPSLFKNFFCKIFEEYLKGGGYIKWELQLKIRLLVQQFFGSRIYIYIYTYKIICVCVDTYFMSYVWTYD